MVGNVEARLTFLESRDQSWKGLLLLWLWISSYLFATLFILLGFEYLFGIPLIILVFGILLSLELRMWLY